MTMTKAQAGRLGGLATLRKHGREHMSKIGSKGAQTTWSRYKWLPYGIDGYALVRKHDQRIVATMTPIAGAS